MDKNENNGRKTTKKKTKIKETSNTLDYFNTEVGEDATKYGEFVCSYFAWVAPEEQKAKVEKLQDITEEK